MLQIVPHKPHKEEKDVLIELNPDERDAYDKYEEVARSIYAELKRQHASSLSSQYIRLLKGLDPLRILCSGGKVDGESYFDFKQAFAERFPSDEFGRFSMDSKIDHVMKELQRIRDEDPTSKSLIFTQYGSTLERLKTILPRHGFNFRTLAGSMTMSQRTKALADFQKDPPTTIFLLSMRYVSGARSTVSLVSQHLSELARLVST